MANVIKLRNSGTANAAPTSLEVGELAVNYADGILYYKNSSNTISILSSALSAQGASSIEISTTPPASPSSGDLWFESDTGKQFIYYDSFWVEISGTDGADGSNAAATTDASALISGTLPDARLSSAIARIASPTFTGVPAVPTANASTNTTQIATTAFVTTADNLKANIASPTFTGTPLAPTANANTNTTQIATTEFVTSAVSTGLASAVINALDDVADVTITTATNGDLLKWNGTAWVNASGYALLSSPTFTGTVATSNLTVSGNLIVSGSTTSVNTETLTVDDNIIILNNNVTGSPTENAGVEVERGTSTNVSLRWNETTDKWEFTNDGTTYSNLGAGGATIGDTAPSSPVAGQIWFNSLTGGTYVYYDSVWVEVGASPYSTLINTINAKGDILVGTADNTIGGLSAGTNGQVLTADSSVTAGLKWATPTVYQAIVANVSDTEIGYLDGVTSAIQAQIDGKQAIVANVSDTEIGYLDGVTSAIQTQLNTKATTGKAIAMAIVFGG